MYIEPGSPWENPFVESFGSRLRDELLSTEQFDTLLEAQVLIGDWKHDTTTTGRTALAGTRRSRTLGLGKRRIKWTDSHKRWTYDWGPVT
jgi:hypothetical protein